MGGSSRHVCLLEYLVGYAGGLSFKARIYHNKIIYDSTMTHPRTHIQEGVRELDRRLASLIALAFDDCPTVCVGLSYLYIMCVCVRFMNGRA